MANRPDLIGVAVSCDTDDPTMKQTDALYRVLSPCGWKQVFYSENKSKIEACNANMGEIDYPWDIVVLVSDDMIPQIRGYDDILRNHMLARFPDTNGILWFNDGHQQQNLNTLTVFGRKMYESFGYMYHPSYKSLFCDTELTDLCKGSLQQKCMYVPYCIIRHEHPGTGFANKMDTLYQRNQKYWNEDMYTYIARKQYSYDWTLLIPTIPGREQSLQRLLISVHEKVSRICPELRLEVVLGFDNKEKSIGAKRQELVHSAQGKYVSFVDDDDEITDAYIEDLWGTIQASIPVMRLRGQIGDYTFTHSLENKLTDPMAKNGVFIRPPNHLNPMMTEVAKLISYRDSFRGEDLDWTIRMSRAGFLTHEHKSEDDRIHYIYNLGSRRVDAGTLQAQANTSYETMLSAVWTPNGAVMPASQSLHEGIRVLRLGSRGFVSK